jgi:hypothetical protein
MKKHIEAYRYGVQHSDDADIVAYQRDGVWQTISMWMIRQPAARCWPSAAQPSGISARCCQSASIADFEVTARNPLHCSRCNVSLAPRNVSEHFGSCSAIVLRN